MPLWPAAAAREENGDVAGPAVREDNGDVAGLAVGEDNGDVAGPAVGEDNSDVAGPAVREDNGDAEAQLGENIFHDAGTWPGMCQNELRVELVRRGPLGFQNKDGPFPANPETNRSMNRRWCLQGSRQRGAATPLMTYVFAILKRFVVVCSAPEQALLEDHLDSRTG